MKLMLLLDVFSWTMMSLMFKILENELCRGVHILLLQQQRSIFQQNFDALALLQLLDIAKGKNYKNDSFSLRTTL